MNIDNFNVCPVSGINPLVTNDAPNTLCYRSEKERSDRILPEQKKRRLQIQELSFDLKRLRMETSTPMERGRHRQLNVDISLSPTEVKSVGCLTQESDPPSFHSGPSQIHRTGASGEFDKILLTPTRREETSWDRDVGAVAMWDAAVVNGLDLFIPAIINRHVGRQEDVSVSLLVDALVDGLNINSWSSNFSNYLEPSETGASDNSRQAEQQEDDRDPDNGAAAEVFNQDNGAAAEVFNQDNGAAAEVLNQVPRIVDEEHTGFHSSYHVRFDPSWYEDFPPPSTYPCVWGNSGRHRRCSTDTRARAKKKIMLWIQYDT